ncbi:hypothetical protein LIER_11352 [Lithospermum erythrorhizon]|uniref:RRM domain-containing protein n=1 Tax=Lithospermum erythrorhizon TaxID=34254 RepID=A0AAV3PPA2_LITER
MEMDHGKLFVGGISWDTNEDQLKEYFQSYGEVMEAVIMKDRATGRARGFGFIVFADPSVADRVVKEKHMIDGRTVEAKKAVPRDAQNVLSRNTSSTHSSPGPVRSKKIFVGGLASTVTESDFKNYFDQFGTIIDIVVMYDHNTQRPRGFGFITYDSEDSVDNVLVKTFHELNGKMVEVKRAVPKELSPGPTRSPLGGHAYGLTGGSSFHNEFTPDFHPNSIGNYGARMDGRFSALSVGRSGYPPFSSSSYGLGQTLESGLYSNYAGGGAFGSTIGVGRGYDTLYSGNSNRYNDPLGYGPSGGGNNSTMNNSSRNVLGSGNFSYTNLQNTNNLINSVSGNVRPFSAFGNTGGIWGSTVSGQDGGNGSLTRNNISYRGGENSFASRVGFSRNTLNNIGGASSFAARNDFHENTFEDLYGGDSLYGETSGSFTLGLGTSTSEIMPNNSVGYVGYSISNGEHRGKKC